LVSFTFKNLPGDYSVGETPVPIPNTEVKPNAPTILGWQRPGKIGITRLSYSYITFLFLTFFFFFLFPNSYFISFLIFLLTSCFISFLFYSLLGPTWPSSTWLANGAALPFFSVPIPTSNHGLLAEVNYKGIVIWKREGTEA